MIRLKRFKHDDIPELISWVPDENFLLQFAGPKYDFINLKRQLEFEVRQAESDNPDIYMYKVISNETKKSIGHAQILDIDMKNLSAQMGRILIGDEDCRGQGFGQAIAEEIIKKAFGELELHRLSLGVFDFNKNALACYNKVGFKVEGTLRECRKMGDEYWSLIMMSILKSDK